MRVYLTSMLVISTVPTYAAQQGMVTFPWGQGLLMTVLHGLSAAVFFFFGALLLTVLSKNPLPNFGRDGRQFFLAYLFSALMLALVEFNSSAAWVVGLLLTIVIAIRFIQWNAFEPNGLAEYDLA